MIRVGINGFGRIGRAIVKLIQETDGVEVSLINDIGSDVHNYVYLYNYDSTYGRPSKRASFVDGRLVIGDSQASFVSHRDIRDVPWKEHETDVVVEASGVANNIFLSHELIRKKIIKKTVVTSSPSENIDKTIILGLNESEYDRASHHVVSSSICDANAVTHVLSVLDKAFGIKNGFITTLHPWLSYQNLVDSPVSAQSNPGNPWQDFSLGRASVRSLIPKNTTVVGAVLKAIPSLEGRLDAISYRVPTDIVSSADLTIELARGVTLNEVDQCFRAFTKGNRYIALNEESLVSLDYVGTEFSGTIDHQWTRLLGDRLLKVVLWYDNEWGYSSRVVDLVKHVMN